MTSVNWHEIPCLRICLPFVAGILSQQFFPGVWPMVSGAAITMTLILLLRFNKSTHRRQQLRTGVLMALVFALGSFTRQAAEPDHECIKFLASNPGNISATVCNAEPSAKGYRATLKVISPVTVADDAKVIAYVRNTPIPILPGDTLIFHGALEEIPASTNPFAFDVAGFYALQGIYLRAFLDTKDIIALRPYRGFHLARKSAQIRERARRIYRTYLRDPQSFAVLEAMTIGIKTDLDDRVRNAYAKSGAMHVLSISGLHVGIVSFLLFILIGRARPTDKTFIKLIRTIILLSGIWGFACIAGLSPSITRAALMFSIYLTGTIIRRPVNGLNVLACTAFVCLCADPLLLNSVSFQFSYLALFGIVIFFKPIYRLIPLQSSSGKFIWGTVVMSISAQIFLFPLLIHYFQQFSFISPLSSLIAIPAAFVILFGGALILLLHALSPVVAAIAGHALDYVISLTNTAIIKLSELPFSHMCIYLSPAEIAVLMGITVLLALRMLIPNKLWTLLTIPTVLLFGAMHVHFLLQARQNALLAIYPDGQLSIDIVSGRSCSATFSIDSMPEFESREVQTFRNQSRLSHAAVTRKVTTDQTHSLLTIDIFSAENEGCSRDRYRIAILTTSDFSLLDAGLTDLRATCVVLSAGLSPAMRKATEDFCIQNDQAFHDLHEQGSFYLTKQENTITHEKHWQYFSG